ncbi:MAG: carboxypeptidase-like regulatory domain-containing protein, partial [Hymenobacter sp.]
MQKQVGPFGLWLLMLLWLTLGPAGAQVRITLSGTVQDASSGENLTGATVRVRELPGVGTGANAYGFYTLTVPAGSYTLEASFVGYGTQTRQLTLGASQRLDFKLKPGSRVSVFITSFSPKSTGTLAICLRSSVSTHICALLMLA